MLFDRLGSQARQVLELAQEEAAGLGHDYLGTEHLLIGLCRLDGFPGDLLAGLGCGPDVARAGVVAVIGRGDPPHRRPDVLLADLGINLGEVRRRVEATFGSEAMAQGHGCGYGLVAGGAATGCRGRAAPRKPCPARCWVVERSGWPPG